MRYLYGASVQGIQEFIFKTNKLQEIVGASEIVKSIETLFKNNFQTDEILLNAAGNIKVIFNTKEECQKAVLGFPKMVMQEAYGITISQAVVKIDSDHTQDNINALEKKLKIQRNRPSIPLDSSINMMKLNPSTAKPLVNKDDDKATQQKRAKYKVWLNSEEKSRNKEFKEISDFSNGKHKIAVVHIDGNGLGQLIPKLTIALSEFSSKLDNATKKAFNDARDESMSIREVVLGGDDVTVICNANDALEFTKRFLTYFEDETSKAFGEDKKLTACAGIAYCNEKYPFHYAVDLAETLCGETKKHAKAINEDLAPSSLMFHTIQSSNFQSWEKFVEDELSIVNDVRYIEKDKEKKKKQPKEQKPIRCDFGPYYLSEPNQPHIKGLQNSIEAYKCDGSPISRLRNWMSELYKSDENAKNLLTRINEVTEQSGKWRCTIMDKNLKNLYLKLSNDDLIVLKDGHDKTPIYDILQILSVTDFKGANS